MESPSEISPGAFSYPLRPTAESPRRDIEPEPLERGRHAAYRRRDTSPARSYRMRARVRRHRTRNRDVHAAITRSVVARRVVGQYPCRSARRNNTNENADRYQHGAVLARRQRLGRWGLASVDRRRLLDRANVTGLTI